MMWRLIRCVMALVAVASSSASAQLVEIQRNGAGEKGLYRYIGPIDSAATAARQKTQKGVETFSRLGVELNTSGQGQAIVQIAKFYVGEPKGYNLPMYLFVNPAAEMTGGEKKKNELAAATLLNPLGGALNLSATQTLRLVGPTDSYTSFKFAYHVSVRSVTGEMETDPSKQITTFVLYGDLGLHFQTGAWRDDPKGQIGVFWVQAKIGGSLGFKEKLQEVFGPDIDASVFHWSLSLAVEVNNYINLKLGVSRAIGKDAKAPAFDEPFIKFAFDVTP